MANRKVDPLYTRAGILKKIIYPTGASLTLEYQNNTTINDTIYTGGLRIKRIINYDSLTQKYLIKEYSYGPGSVRFDPMFYYFFIHQGSGYGTTVPKVRIYGNPRFPLFSNNGSPVLYQNVTEKTVGNGEEFLSVHSFTGYDFHIGYYTDGGIGVPHPKIPIPEDFLGLEIGSDIYKRNSNGTQTLIQATSTGYSSISNPAKHIWNVQSAWVSPQGGSEWFEWPSNDPFNQSPQGIPAYGSTSQHIYELLPEAAIKTSEIQRTIVGTDTLTVPSFYEYDNSNGNVLAIKTVNSINDTTIKLIKYSANFAHTGANSGNNHQIDLLLDYNVLSSPIEILILFKKKDSTNFYLQDATLYEYDSLKVKKVYKVYEKMPYALFNVAYNDAAGFYKDRHYTLYQEIVDFDNEKNPKTVIANQNTESYKWDGDLLIARTINAGENETAFSSFETLQKGGWAYSPLPTSDPTSPTGNKCYNMASGNIYKTGLFPGTTYIITFWKKNGIGTVSVNGISGIIITNKNGWVLMKHEISGVSSVTISGQGFIDELRMYPKGTQMTTFTYKPLVGISTKCDAANHITYYVYEGDRLKMIKDADGKIIKRIDYKYQGTYHD
jgi:hypothetical protein